MKKIDRHACSVIRRLNILLTTSLLFVLLAATNSFAADTTYYVTQSGSGTGDGKSLANAWSAADFNTADNWDSADNADKIDPGDTVSLNGTITTKLTVQGSGTSGNQIVIDGSNVTMNVSADNQIMLNGGGSGKSYITIQNVTFSPSISSKWLMGTGNAVSTNVIVKNSIYNGPSNSTVGFFYAGRTSYSTFDNNTMTNILRGVWGDKTDTHDLTISNNTFITVLSDTTTDVSDIIKLGDAYNVTIEGNKMVMRKGHDTPHCDIIQTYESSGSSTGAPYNWTIRHNWIELNTTSRSNKSWMMIEEMTGDFKIYGNHFIGTDGGENGNGIRIHYGVAPYNLYIHNNVFYKKSGPGNTFNIDDTFTVFELKNNISYDEGTSVIFDSSGTPTYPTREYNSYYGGSSGGYGGSNCTNWISGKTGSVCNQDPLFTDTANDDYNIQFGSPVIDAGLDLGAEYTLQIAPSATWPNPSLLTTTTWGIGAYVYDGEPSDSISPSQPQNLLVQ